MYRNVAAKLQLFAFDVTTGLPKTGDAANLTAYVSKDGGAVTVLADTSATEMEATNAKGWYMFDLAQGETDAVDLLFTGKSSTANISIVGRPIATSPNRFTGLVIDAAGLADANTVKVGPTGSGTAQTAGDIMADTNDIQTRLPAALVGGRMDSSTGAMATNVLTATAINADAITAAKIADGAIDAATFAAGAINAAAIAADAITDAKVAADVTIASVTGAVGSVTGAVGSIATGGIAAASFAAGAINAAAIAADAITAAKVADGTIDAATFAAGAINAAAIAADAITDAKVAADVTIASVTGAVGSVTGLTASDVGAIKTKTDFLPSATAGAAGGVFIAGSNAATSITTALTANVVGNVTGNLSGSVGSVTGAVGSVTGAVGSVTGNVGGNVTGSVGSVATGGIAAASFAAGAIDAAAIATDAIGALEIAAGAAAEIATAVRTELATELARVDVAISTRASQTSVDTIDDFLDTEVAAIKAKTDQLTFSTTNRVDAQVFGMEAGTVTAAAIATDAIDADAIKADAVTEIQSGLATAAALATVAGFVDTEVAAILAAVDTEVAAIKAKTDNLPASPAAVSDIPTAAANADAVWDELIAGHAISGSTGEALSNAGAAGTPPTAAAISDAVWDELLSGHVVSGSSGAALSAAGTAGDPWLTALPGAYGAGTAGKIVGDNINATIGSRATQTSVDDLPTNAELATALGTADDAVLAQVALVKAKTDNLPSDPADASDIASSFGTVNGTLGTIAGYLDTEVAAIKAKTDLIPASPAAVGDVPTAAQNADKILGRNLAGGSDGGRMVKDALRSLRNKTSIAAGTLTVTQEDDTTTAWTAAVTTAPGDPLTSIDPA